MIKAIVHVATYGGDQAIAGERGLGKTSIAQRVVLMLMIWGRVRFPIFISKNGPEARGSLEEVKDELENNDTLADDYPEVCAPIRALEGAPQRASQQTVNGQRTRIRWKEDYIIFPTVKGSRASGVILVARGIDGSIRGMKKRSIRPDVVIIDDPDSEESAESASETDKRTRTIDRAVAGLAGPGKRIARVMLCSCMNRRCVAYTFTDPQQKPSWNGKRYRMLITPPAAEEHWERYILLRQQGQQNGDDPTGRAATAYYKANLRAMNRGAKVSDDERFVSEAGPDGEPIEISALQHCYNIIADRGMENFLTECQNDPPEEIMPETSGITPTLVQTRLSRTDKGVVPDGTMALTAGVDVGRYGLHWMVIAWRDEAVGTIIDHGVEDVHSPKMQRDQGRKRGEEFKEQGVQHAILQALRSLRLMWITDSYCGLDDTPMSIWPIGVDYGYYSDAVMAFVREVGGDPWRAMKGHGTGKGLAAFRQIRKPSADIPRRHIGDQWYATREPMHQLLYHTHTDYWKRWVHDRFGTKPGDPGSMTLFGDEARIHITVSHHLTAEQEETKFIPGVGSVTKWIPIRANNHWFDACYMACVAANMAGVKLLPTGAPKTAPRATGRFTPTERKAQSPWSVYRSKGQALARH